MEKNTAARKRGDTSFVGVLQQCARGVVADELDTQLRDLVKKVLDTNKAGTLDVKIRVDPKGAGRVTVQASSKATPPKEEMEGSIFFVDDEFGLCRDNPQQRRIPLMMDDGDSGAAGDE